MNTTNKSDNKIGLIYNTDTNNYKLKSIPKHMKIIKNVSEVSHVNPTTNDISKYNSDISLPSETSSEQSSNPSENNYDNQSFSSKSSDYNIFKQNSTQKPKFNKDVLNDVNNSLSALNMQVMSLCNKKKQII